MKRISLLLCFALFAAIQAASAGSITYLVSVNTNSSWVPGYIDFELNPANPAFSLPADATIFGFASSGFTFGASTYATPGVTGDLGSLPIVIPNLPNNVNYFTQEVSAWGSLFSFRVTLSGPAVGGSGSFGSDFYLNLFDTGFNYIVSPLPSGAIAQITLNQDGSLSPTGSQFEGGDASVESIPEPGTAMVGLGLLALAALRVRRRNR